MNAKRILPLLLFISMLPACSGPKYAKQKEMLYREYREIRRIHDQKIESGRKRLRQMVKPWERRKQKKAIAGFMQGKQKAMSAFLEKLEKNSPITPEFQLLRARVLMEAGNFEEAENQLNKIPAAAGSTGGARMERLRLHILSRKTTKALDLFRDLEKTMKDPDFYTSCLLYFSFYAPEPGLRKEYSERFLNLQSIPSELSEREPHIRAYLNLSFKENERIQPDQLQQDLSRQEIALLPRLDQLLIQSEQGRYSLTGQPIRFSINDNWLEFPALLRQNRLNAKLIIVSWAHWLPESKDLLLKFQREKPSGFTVIGMTKLYGFTNSDSGMSASPQEEVNYIHRLAGLPGSDLPLLISTEGNWLQESGISLLPAVVIANEGMIVESIEFGTSNGLRLLERIVNSKRGE